MISMVGLEKYACLRSFINQLQQPVTRAFLWRSVSFKSTHHFSRTTIWGNTAYDLKSEDCDPYLGKIFLTFSTMICPLLLSGTWFRMSQINTKYYAICYNFLKWRNNFLIVIFQSKMEKEVESLNKDILKDAKSKESVKVPAQIDGKELVKLFKNCSIVEKSKPSQVRNSKNWRISKNNLASSSQKSFKRKKVMQKKTKKPKFRVNIRPSKLTSIVEKIQSDQKSPESRFSDFSDCNRFLQRFPI